MAAESGVEPFFTPQFHGLPVFEIGLLERDQVLCWPTQRDLVPLYVQLVLDSIGAETGERIFIGIGGIALLKELLARAEVNR